MKYRESFFNSTNLSKFIEAYIWMVGASLLFYMAFHRSSGGIDSIFYNGDPFFYLSVFFFSFPVIFNLIFGSMPFWYLRKRSAIRRMKALSLFKDVADEGHDMLELKAYQDGLGVGELSNASTLKLLSYYASSSRELSQSIYSRAGVYLLVGVFVAFSGLFFFYTSTVQSQSALGPVFQMPNSQEAMSILIILIPKFGILFFIEFVAFFFLKQYRSAMDEFRYYEAIKRNREEVLALVRMSESNGKLLDPAELFKSQTYFSKAGTLEKNQSTEIIEARKLEKSELELLGKVIEAVARDKK
ncbi:hypothetical protein AA0N74_01445 [Chromobacterium vaccinii]|uniref:hypothetical protein n=1 Tax=Chromobacterium vaccinii TaxID=1108595 RepID=UPI0031CE2F8D